MTTAFPPLEIRGSVIRNTEDDAVRWSYQVYYGNAMQWSLEGVQIGQERSEMGVIGVWTRPAVPFGGLVEGPCGPFRWWISED